MVIPHDHVRTLNLKIPVAFLAGTIFLACVGGGYLLNMAVTGIWYRAQHREMAGKVKYYSEQFYQWSSTVQTLKSVGNDFQRLLSMGSKEKVLEAADTDFTGTLELPDLINELQKTKLGMEEIQNYLRKTQDVFKATPRGFPVPGKITSPYGHRHDPLGEGIRFHSGMDISSASGTPILATADGIVSHSGWTTNSGQVVVLEHGLGFSTVYAHNQKNSVKVGQTVKRGDVIGYVGSTGRSTGPHLHYEVWKDGKHINPKPYLSGEGI